MTSSTARRPLRTQGDRPMKKYEMFVNNAWKQPASGEWFESMDPYTGKTWALIPRGNAQDADEAVQVAHKAFTSGEWPKLNATQRGALLRKLGDLIARNAKHLA